ncbi:hypothetical protein [Thermaurantimonas aggregans]|uniref:hypothetical protein n=1 Tax=Thermaurantimonas aggregans TaxID=2173829 RepID=UPI000F5839BB|nr:hypothetical protein [Thermaurantimonas aggregans]
MVGSVVMMKMDVYALHHGRKYRRKPLTKAPKCSFRIFLFFEFGRAPGEGARKHLAGVGPFLARSSLGATLRYALPASPSPSRHLTRQQPSAAFNYFY